MGDYMKKPCAHCPFRKDVKPFLHPSRGEELAWHTQNPYNSFTCHKTTEADEESEESEMLIVESSKECAGFIIMQLIENGMDYAPEGFDPSWDLVYESAYDMEYAYSEEGKKDFE